MAPTSKDVVVVGGGPAGSVTARQLAQRGCNVLLLDARNFPREKACGGGIQHRCLPYLPDDFLSVTKATCTSVRLTYGLRSTMVKSAGRPVGQAMSFHSTSGSTRATSSRTCASA